MKITVIYNGERGRHVVEALLGTEHTVNTVTDTDVNDPKFIKEVDDVDLIICAGYSQIFSKVLLDAPRLGVWNCHAGPVPEYRGGSPLNWQIIDGKDELTVSLLKMDEGIDTGGIIGTASTTFPDTYTIVDAHNWANIAFPLLIVDALSRVAKDGDVMALAQPESDAYKKQRNDDMGEIGVLWDAQRVHNFVRALTHPYPGAYIKDGHGRKLRIWSTSTD